MARTLDLRIKRIGKKIGRLSLNKVSLAMGVRGERNMHYKLGEIQRRHWVATAKRNGLTDEVDQIFQDAIDRGNQGQTTIISALKK